jgi:hypothetical protein
VTPDFRAERREIRGFFDMFPSIFLLLLHPNATQTSRHQILGWKGSNHKKTSCASAPSIWLRTTTSPIIMRSRGGQVAGEGTIEQPSKHTSSQPASDGLSH